MNLKIFVSVILMALIVACGGGASSTHGSKAKSGDINVNVFATSHQQGIRLAIDPTTGSTITSATYQLFKGAGRVLTDQGNIPLDKLTYISIGTVGDYCLDVTIVTADGRTGTGESCFTLGADQVLNVTVNITLGAYGQGINVTVHVLKTTIQFSYSGDLTAPTISCTSDWTGFSPTLNLVTGGMNAQGDGSFGFTGLLKNNTTYWCFLKGYDSGGIAQWIYQPGPPDGLWKYRPGNSMTANGIQFFQTGSQYCGVGVVYNEILVDSTGIHMNPNPICY